jgi:protein gp37
MSGIHRTKIDWADSTWNPVSGCLHGCPHCYAKTIAWRFKPKPSEWPEPNTVKEAADPRCFIATKPTVLRDADGKYLRSTAYPRGFEPTMHTYKMAYLQTAIEPRRIFVGSMTDLFGEWVPDEWLAAIFRECYEAPQHVYMFLTQNPMRYALLAESGLLPRGDNYWYGSTMTTQDAPDFKDLTDSQDRYNTFASIEPILGRFERQVQLQRRPHDWTIVGKMGGPSASKHKPPPAWIEEIVNGCREDNSPVFLKNSLAPYWTGDLPQEYPDRMMAWIDKKEDRA